MVRAVCQPSWPVAIAACPMAIGPLHALSKPRGPEEDDRQFCLTDILARVQFFENHDGMASSGNDNSALTDYTAIWKPLPRRRELIHCGLVTYRQFLSPL